MTQARCAILMRKFPIILLSLVISSGCRDKPEKERIALEQQITPLVIELASLKAEIITLKEAATRKDDQLNKIMPLIAEVETLRSKTNSLQNAVTDKSKENAVLEQELNVLRNELNKYINEQENAYQLSRNLRASGQLIDAAREYNKFIRTYPTSPRVSSAVAELTELQDEIAEHQQKYQLIKDMKSSSKDLGVWSTILRGKNKEWVREYMGEPDSISFDSWTYAGKVKDMDKTRTLRLEFVDDVVAKLFSRGY